MERPTILAVVQADLQLICAMRDTLEETGRARLAIARNSQEAILYLRGVGIYGDRWRHPLPDVVLLDCENPNSADLEVLAWMRESESFRKTPVVLLSLEEHRPLRVSCMLDPSCLIADRQNLEEVIDALGIIEASRVSAAARPNSPFPPLRPPLESVAWT